MKKLFGIVLVSIFASVMSFAQAPQSFKYQAIARDVEGNVISDQQINMRISLLQESKTGTAVYSETHKLKTNRFGLINLEIGMGKNKSGDFAAIDWESGKYYVNVEIDVSGGTDFVSMGISQLLSVPYALYAEKSGTSASLSTGSSASLSTGAKEANSWTDGASVTYLTNSGWDVGIGTSAPTSKLDVIGKGTFENVYGTKTDVTTASGHLVSNKFEVLYEPTSTSAVKGSSLQIKAVTADPAITDFTSFLQGLRFSLIHRNNGAVAQLIGGRFQMGMPTGTWGGTGTTGTITSMKGIDMELYSQKGITIFGTGISLESIGSNFSNLTYLRINQPTDVAGNYGIYNNSSYDNYFAGNVGIGTTTPAGILDIAGAYHFPSVDGTNGQVLKTNGSGTLSWGSAAGGATAINDLSDGKTSGNSVFLGLNAGMNDNSSDNQSVAVGKNAFMTNTTGILNTAVGFQALYANTTGSQNTALGTNALVDNTIGEHNTGVGYGALDENIEGDWNSSLGQTSLGSNTYGNYNNAIGGRALLNNTTGEGNIGIGFDAGYRNTSGMKNITIGTEANYYNGTGSYNTIIGHEAGQGTSIHNKSGNVFLGYQAGYFSTVDNRLYIDNSSSSAPLIYGEFDNDLLIIYGRLGVGGPAPSDTKLSVTHDDLYAGNFTSDYANGSTQVIRAEYTGTGNYDATAVYGKSTPVANQWYGYGGQFEGNYIGINAVNNPGSSPNTTYGIYSTSGGTAGTRFALKARVSGGTTRYGVYGDAFADTNSYAVYCDGNGVYTGTWTNVSDRKLKKNVQPINNALNRVMQLEAKTYDFKTSEYDYINLAQGKHFGFIAQEMENILPELVSTIAHPKPNGKDTEIVEFKGINYIELVPLLTQAIREQQEIIEKLEERIETLENK